MIIAAGIAEGYGDAARQLTLHASAVFHRIWPLDVGIRPAHCHNAELRILRRSDLVVLSNVVTVCISPSTDVGVFEHRIVDLREPYRRKRLHVLANTAADGRLGVSKKIVSNAEAWCDVVPVGQIRDFRKSASRYESP